MMISCADSRVMPHMITHSGPGDVFTVQNVGNLAGGQGTAAAVEYASTVLDVPLIAVCGHSGCGAMNGLRVRRGRAATGELGTAGCWTPAPCCAPGSAGTRSAMRPPPRASPRSDQLAMVNVAMQLEMLRAKDTGAELMGLFYDIATARVLVLDGRDPAVRRTRAPTGLDTEDMLARIAAGHGHAADRREQLPG